MATKSQRNSASRLDRSASGRAQAQSAGLALQPSEPPQPLQPVCRHQLPGQRKTLCCCSPGPRERHCARHYQSGAITAERCAQLRRQIELTLTAHNIKAKARCC